MMEVRLSEIEIRFLTKLLMAESRVKSERMLHAASHNSDFYDPDAATVEQLIEKIYGPRRDMEPDESPGGTL